MSAELARRLIHSGAETAQVEAALFAAVRRGISLTQAVNELHPALIELLDRALDRSDFPAIHTVRALPDIVRRLPLGMCRRLLALPVHRDARSERIDIAAVDVADPHVAREFAFHLGGPVRLLRAPYAELISSLAELHAAGTFLSGPPRIANGNHGVTVGAGESSAAAKSSPRSVLSEPPIPLIRKPLAPISPWIGDAPEVSLIMPELDDLAPEPVLSLSRPKPLPALDVVGRAWALQVEVAVAEIERAQSPEQVVTALCEALRPLRSLVFAVRGASFEVRAGSPELGSASELRALSVPFGEGSMLDVALRVGYYCGPRPKLAPLCVLEGRWGVPAQRECYARAIHVSERPSLILVVTGFHDSNEATRRADVVARTAGSALEHIVRSRKRG